MISINPITQNQIKYHPYIIQVATTTNVATKKGYPIWIAFSIIRD
jgi:hypothetical protein